VELLVAMALGMLLVSAAGTLFVATRQVALEQERIAEMNENLRFAADFMTRDIRAAGLLASGAFDLAGGVEPADPTEDEQAVFTVRKAGMNCLGDTGPWVASVYSVQGKRLRCGNDATPPQNQPLVSGVLSLKAVALNADGDPDWVDPVSLRIELVLEREVGSQVLTRTLEFVVSLRNAVLHQHQSR
jgi:type IV pilus assembly protein PilW